MSLTRRSGLISPQFFTERHKTTNATREASSVIRWSLLCYCFWVWLSPNSQLASNHHPASNHLTGFHYPNSWLLTQLLLFQAASLFKLLWVTSVTLSPSSMTLAGPRKLNIKSSATLSMMNAWVATPTCMALTKSMLQTLSPNSTNSWHLWIRQVKMQLAFTQALCMSLSWKLQLRNPTSSSRPDPRPTHPPTESRIDKLVKRPTQSYSKWPLLTVSWLWLLLSTSCKREWMDSSIFRSFQEWSWKLTGLVTLFSTYSNGRCSWWQPLSFGSPLV